MIYALIGNGFDLAHGLKTRYKDFISFIVSSERISDQPFQEFLKKQDLITFYEHCKEAYDYPKQYGPIEFGIKLFEDAKNQKWSDIEVEYFNALKIEDVRNLNRSFERIKLLLQFYLKHHCSYQSKPISVYKEILGGTVINFNYTNTSSIYTSARKYNLHGQLFNDDYPIIFGYSADDSDVNALVQKGDPQYLWNIKRLCYHQSNVYQKLIQQLNSDSEKSELWLCGHSCGLSDSQILNELIKNPKIEKVRILYYKNRDNFRLNQISLLSIVEPDLLFRKLQPFNKLMRMPQVDDNLNDPEIISSYNYICNLIPRAFRTNSNIGFY